MTFSDSFCVGIITWRIVVWRRRKAFTASQKYLQGGFSPNEKMRPIVDSTPLEKQEVLVILPMEPPRTAQPHESGKWKPQIFSHNGVPAPVGPDVKVPLMSEGALSPPPTYTPTSSPPARTPSPRPPALNIPAVIVAHDETPKTGHLTVPVAPSPVPSPRRTSSFGLETPKGLSDGGANLRPKPSVKGQKLPRKMLVEHTFVPSLADELAIKVGEVLLMLEEYEDEWCLAERVGKNAGDRGVVPRFCLRERPRGHRRGASSTSHASSTKSGASNRVQ